MTPKLKNAEYAGGYRISLSYEDGTKGTIDLKDDLWGEVFEPLKDTAVFQSFKIDSELQTITWPTGADLAPEFLYEKASA